MPWKTVLPEQSYLLQAEVQSVRDLLEAYYIYIFGKHYVTELSLTLSNKKIYVTELIMTPPHGG